MQLEIPYHPLYRNEKLQPSIDWDITNQLLEQLQSTKEWIEQQQSDGYMVAVVHLSGDLWHASHTQYLNTIRAKLRKEVWKPFKLLVGVESDLRTKERKWKDNVYSENERKYIVENLKAVDKCYIEFEWLDEQNNNSRPAWIVRYLQPNIFTSHIEHIGLDEEMVREKAKENWIPYTVIINELDEHKYLWEESNRDKYQLSTTNIIRKIIKNFKWNSKYDIEL